MRNLSKKDSKEFIKTIQLAIGEQMPYSVILKNDKDKDKYIKRCERIIRSSMEYRDYIRFLREYVDMGRCAFFNMINSEDSKRVKIEIHHEPFTLYDYTKVVVERFLDEGIPLNDLMVAEEVMELHYNNLVGLIPLSKTIHQAVHASTKIPIPLTMVYGNYSAFLSDPKYEKYKKDLLDKLETKINQTKNLTEESFDAIRKQFTYLEIKDVKPMEKIEIASLSEKCA